MPDRSAWFNLRCLARCSTPHADDKTGAPPETFITKRLMLSGVTPRTARTRAKRALVQRGFAVQRQPGGGMGGWHGHLRCRVVVHAVGNSPQRITVLIHVLATSRALAEQEGAGLRKHRQAVARTILVEQLVDYQKVAKNSDAPLLSIRRRGQRRATCIFASLS